MYTGNYMKKLYLALFMSVLLVGCTNKPLTKEALVGEWICETEYTHMNAGTIDIMTLNADGTLKDDNYIFDHSLSAEFERKITNYFSFPFRYIKVNDGSWDLSGNTLTYHLKQKNFKRLIWPDIFEEIQKSDYLRNVENELFKIYSSSDNEVITLTFDKFIKNGFLLKQNIANKIYTSKCLTKKVSKYGYIEAYKQIHQIK